MPAPPQASAPSPFRDGRYWCTLCDNRGFTTVPGLMRHIGCAHAGCVVDENTRALLVAIERVTCANPACRGFRRAGTRTCNRCLQGTDVRPPQVGDIIPGPASSFVHAPDQPAADTPVVSNVSQDSDAAVEPLSLPSDFSQRVRKLPCHTLLHIPISCRLRMLNIMENTLQGISASPGTHAQA